MVEPTEAALGAAQLRAQGRALRAPFVLRFGTVPLPGGADAVEFEVHCSAVLRLLPGKRLVAVGRWGRDTVLLKLFFGSRCAVAAAREILGLQVMNDAGFATPDVIAQARLLPAHDHGHVLLLRYLDDAQPLSVVWRHADGAQRKRLLTTLATRLAALHASGAAHADLHFDNFLLDRDQMFAVDGGGVRRGPRFPVDGHAPGALAGVTPAAEAFGIDNLALLLAQLPLQDAGLADAGLNAYTLARSWAPSAARAVSFSESVARQRALRVARYLRKVYRECTEFTVVRTPLSLTVTQRDLADELRVVLADPDMAIAAGEVLKAGRSATVARVRGHRRWWVIKRYNVKGPLHALRRASRRTRAEWSWRNGQRLKLLGIASALPVALQVETLGPLRGRGYLITEALGGAPLDEKLRSGWRPDAAALADIERILGGLLDQRLVHGDLKASNFVVTDEGVRLVDLDGMREVRDAERLARRFGRDIVRFHRNWADDPALDAMFRPVTARLVRPTR